MDTTWCAYSTLGGASCAAYSRDIAEACRSRGFIVEQVGAMWEIKLKTRWWQIWK